MEDVDENSLFCIGDDTWEDFKEYRSSYKHVIKKREEYKMIFRHLSPQMSYRPYLIGYLKNVCIEMSLARRTLHLAVYLMDIFMDNYSVSPEKLQLLSHSCLLLAAKIEEDMSKIPKISQLNDKVNNRYSLQEYKQLEIVVLQFFQWFIMFPTAAQYTHYYLHLVISNEDIDDNIINNNNNGHDKASVRKLFYDINDSVVENLDKIIENVHIMHHFQPSKLAGAVLALSRKEKGLPEWTKQLEYITDFKPEDLKDEMAALKKGKNFKCFK